MFSCSPSHKIIAPASSNSLRTKIDKQLNANYEEYAGCPVLVACIAEINGLANESQNPKRSKGEFEFNADKLFLFREISSHSEKKRKSKAGEDEAVQVEQWRKYRGQKVGVPSASRQNQVQRGGNLHVFLSIK
jgi:hypothetical protein